jgi:hypothetical protein
LVLETRLRRHDNLEGLSVWRDPAGRLRLTMLSDDNLRQWLQRTEFVDYIVEDRVAGPPGDRARPRRPAERSGG